MSDLVLIEKYDSFLHYIYPTLQEIPRKHGVFKARVIELVFMQAELIYRAIKSNQKSKLYEVDAGLATIRHHLRFLSETRNITTEIDEQTSKAVRKVGKYLLSSKRHQVASILLAVVGKIVGSMIKGK